MTYSQKTSQATLKKKNLINIKRYGNVLKHILVLLFTATMLSNNQRF